MEPQSRPHSRHCSQQEWLRRHGIARIYAPTTAAPPAGPLHATSQSASLNQACHTGTGAYSSSEQEPLRPDSGRTQCFSGHDGDEVCSSTEHHELQELFSRTLSSGHARSSHRKDRLDGTRPPLSLQIFSTRDLPRYSTTPPTSTSSNFPPKDLFGKQRLPTPPTSLPTLRSSGNSQPSNGEPLFERSYRSCYRCLSLAPVADDISHVVVDLVAEINALVNNGDARVCCSRQGAEHTIADHSKPAVPPTTDLLGVMRWLLRTLWHTKLNIQNNVSRGAIGTSSSLPPTSNPKVGRFSPPNLLKREFDSGSQTNTPHSKRSRSEVFPGSYAASESAVFSQLNSPNSLDSPLQQLPPMLLSTRADVQPSERVRVPGFSTPPISALPLAQDIVPHSQPHTPHHTSSTMTSATLAHLSGLQHQVTVKAIALQNLESEYESLSHRFHRERSRTQAIEAKANAAECEVSDLASKYEDLVDQYKTIETQLKETENKLNAERARSVKEKVQWLEMLKRADALSREAATERSKMVEDIARLSQRLSYFDRDVAQEDTQTQNGRASQDKTSTQHPNTQESSLDITTDSLTAHCEKMSAPGLRGEIAVHDQKVETLRLALVEARRRNEQLTYDMRALSTKHDGWNSTIVSVLKDNDDGNSPRDDHVSSQSYSVSLERHARIPSIHHLLNAAPSAYCSGPGTLSDRHATPGTKDSGSPTQRSMSPYDMPAIRERSRMTFDR